MVHNYLRYQTSKADVEKLTAKKQKAGRKGAKTRWKVIRGPTQT